MLYTLIAAALAVSVSAIPFADPHRHVHAEDGAHVHVRDANVPVKIFTEVATKTVHVTVTRTGHPSAHVAAPPAYATPSNRPHVSTRTRKSSRTRKPTHKTEKPTKATVKPSPKPPKAQRPKPNTSAAPKPTGFHPHPFPYPAPKPSKTYWSAPQGTQAPQCSQPDQSYISTALRFHNRKRHIHQANPLVWDQKLACIAQQQADTCQFAHLMNVGGGGYGQNIASTSLEGSMKMWYNEEPKWSPNYGNPGAVFDKSTGHFTAMVWASSTSLGCATANCNGGQYTVCNYFVFPNMAGGYAANVKPPKRA